MFGFVKSVGLPAWPAQLHSESGGRMRVAFLGTSKTALINKKEWLPYTRGEFEKVDTLKNRRRWGALTAALKELREALNGGKEETEVKTQKKATRNEDSQGRRIGLRKQQRDNERKFSEVMKKLITRQWQCTRCNFKTGFKYRAKTHAVLCSSMFRARKKRNKVYTCHSCPETTTFVSKKLLNSHTKEKHPCVFLCVEHPRPISFTLRQNLLRHIEEIHSAEVKTFQCPECDVKSLRKDHISRHVKRRHPLRQDVIELLNNLTAGVVDIVQEKRQKKCYVEFLLDQIIKNAISVQEHSFKDNNCNIEDNTPKCKISHNPTHEGLVEDGLLTKNNPQELNHLQVIVQRIVKSVREKRQNKLYVESLLEQIIKEVVKGHSNVDCEESDNAAPNGNVAVMKQSSFEEIQDNIETRDSLAKNKSQTLERIEANKKEFRARWEEIFKEEIEEQRKLNDAKVLKNEARKAALKRKQEMANSYDEPRRKSARLCEQLLSPSGDNIIEQIVIDDRGHINEISNIEMSNEIYDITSPEDLKPSEQVNNEENNALELKGDVEHDKENIPPSNKSSSKKYECNQHRKCSFKARDNFNLQKHIRIKHAEGPVACVKPWCKMMLQTLFEQELHLKQCVYVCNKCGKSFSRPCKMREHQRYEAARAIKLSM